MQFIRVFATLLAFGQYHRYNSLRSGVAYQSGFLAAASALASPIPAASLAKKEAGTVKYNILVREPEAEGSDVGILAREPEIVEAREPSPICNDRQCV